MKFNFSFAGLEFGAILSARRILRSPVAGITNRTQDGYYVLFLDYDEMPLSWLQGELRDIQNEFGLNDLYIFKSGEDKYHVVGFDKLTREKYQMILARSSCDPMYKKIPFTFGRRVATLRATEKAGRKIVFEKRFLHSIKPIPRELSNAHAYFFKNIYNIELPEGEYDKETELIMAKYRI